ncbi:MAG: phosphoribosylformylglycinamidine synthase, partial [Desulfobacterales bacterium]|nr:phosphoribosylformylglycinamidine synthase [Desulfobacterales bacterium]
MPCRLEVTFKDHLVDAEGEGLRKKAQAYFGIGIDRVRTVNVLTMDVGLSPDQLETIRNDIFTNPVTQVSSYRPLPVDGDWIIWVGFRPGVRDNPGATAVEAIEDLLGIRLAAEEAVYTSKRYCLSGRRLIRKDVEKIAGELLANDIIQQWRIWSRQEWNPDEGTGVIIPRVRLDHSPTVTVIPIDSDATLKRISDERHLALNPNDIPVIRAYFSDPRVRSERAQMGLSDPT